MFPKELYNNQNPLVIIADDPTPFRRMIVRDLLLSYARGLATPAAVDLVFEHEGDLCKVVAAAGKLAETGIWYDLEAYLLEVDENEVTPEGEFVQENTKWVGSDLEMLFRFSLLRTEDFLVRLVFAKGLADESNDSLVVLRKEMTYSTEKFQKWVRQNETTEEAERINGDFDLLYVLRNICSHSLHTPSSPGVYFEPNPRMLDILKKQHVLYPEYEHEDAREKGMALTLQFDYGSNFFATWRVIGRCYDYLRRVNGQPGNLTSLIDGIQDVANRARQLDKGASRADG